MIQLTNLTNGPKQAFNLVGEEGQIIPMTLTYLPRIGSWKFSLSWNGTEIDGALLTCSPNILRNYRNVFSFGILCGSTDGFEPKYLNDFQSGRVLIYLLNRADVAEVESLIFV
jgi:hypothetical protein